MFELKPDTAAEWLLRQGMACHDCRFSELGGGVSNKVILAQGPGQSIVLKQSLGKLRVSAEWLSDRQRIFREAAAMQWLSSQPFRGGHVPRLLAQDPETFSIAMEAAPPSAEMWKTKLFRAEFHPEAATAAGILLGSIIRVSWQNPEAAELFGDQTVFHQLRIDPYYRFTAARHPEFADYFDALITRSAGRRVALTHGDWSPKNLLFADHNLWAIDWEVIHFGDPSYDVAFLLNHLLLKSIAMPAHRDTLTTLANTFVEALNNEIPRDAAWLEEAAMEHLPALLLARVDGKSPAEYLDPDMLNQARNKAISLLRNPAHTVTEAFTR
jgi:5-methylthioribose kinase